MADVLPQGLLSRWELAAEAVAIRIRWFGLLVGYILVNFVNRRPEAQLVLNAILTLGLLYALADTFVSVRGRVFLGRYPLAISMMEALFIGLLCYYDAGLESPFRYYYLLSLICCTVRHPTRITFLTYIFHSVSYGVLYTALPVEARLPGTLILMLVLFGWVAWAGDALARLLKHMGNHLARLNSALQQHQAELEARIAERTGELQAAQALLLHQEKMAAFGLLAAGIAHEVGNPLTSISALVQLLLRQSTDGSTREKLTLINGQLQRIQSTLRELVVFSRPASNERARVNLDTVVQEALDIAKYYKGGKARTINTVLPGHGLALIGVRDQLVQVLLNLVLNAIDATDRGGRIDITATQRGSEICIEVADNGSGIAGEDVARLFQPYFTTKKHGTGLGLFVSRKLVADHGGILEFDAGHTPGALFRICLPTAAPGRNAHRETMIPESAGAAVMPAPTQ